jgi:hypothetical protein
MKDFKRFLAKPTHLSLVMLASLCVVTIVLAMQAFVRLGERVPVYFPWFSFGIVAVFILAAGVLLMVRAIVWMYREYPAEMHEADMQRRRAIRQADSWAAKWLASARNIRLPRVLIVSGWAVVPGFAALIGLGFAGIWH